jgi:hypothetical protein
MKKEGLANELREILWIDVLDIRLLGVKLVDLRGVDIESANDIAFAKKFNSEREPHIT